MKKIIIINAGSNIPAIPYDNIGLLYECAPDNPLLEAKNVIPITELFGDLEKFSQSACELSKIILEDEPIFRGVPQLSIFQEKLAWEIQQFFCLVSLHSYLEVNKFTICEFLTPSWWGEELLKLNSILGSSLEIITPKPIIRSKFRKFLNRISTSNLSFKSIKFEIMFALEQLDPYHKMSLFFQFFVKREKYEKNRIWFYSTAATFTNIGLLYESYFPNQFTFLVENQWRGGKPLLDISRKFTMLYNFARKKFIPSKNEIIDAEQSILRHIENKVLYGQDNIIRLLLLKSEWLNCFFKRLLPNGLYVSNICKNWIDETSPSWLIVGNFAFEGYALYQAKNFKIPTVLLQHGTMGNTYPYLDHPCDYYIVRGQVWYESLSDLSQKRALILNPYKKIIPFSSKKKVIVYVTSPMHMRYMPINVDIEVIFKTICNAISHGNADELIIRVHPLERISDYENQLKTLGVNIPPTCKIIFSQHEPLDAIMARAAAVIMFSSTVFLECIKYNVPIISFDWYSFWFKRRVKAHPLFYFSKNLNELSDLIIKAIENNLVVSCMHSNAILDKTEDEKITTIIKKMLSESDTTWVHTQKLCQQLNEVMIFDNEGLH